MWRGTLAIGLAILVPGIALGQVDLRSVAGRPEVWPHDVLTKAQIPAAAKNAAPLPVGTAMKVVGLEGPLIDLDYRGELYAVPVAQTDFLERAALNAANRPAPAAPRPTPPPAAEPAVESAPPPPAARVTENTLVTKLAPELLVFDHSVNVDKLIPGGGDALHHGYLLLEFGGGRRWATALKDLVPAMQAARGKGADFGTVLVPLQGGSVQSSIGLYRDNAFDGPIVDARKVQTVTDLWSKYGHEGTFGLTLVAPDGTIVAQTVPKGKGLDDFGKVMEALAGLPKR